TKAGCSRPRWRPSAGRPSPTTTSRGEVRDDGVDPALRDDPAPQEVPHVRGERVDLPLVGVEREHVVPAALVAPERGVEGLLERRGLPLEPGGELLVAPDLPGELREPPLRVV